MKSSYHGFYVGLTIFLLSFSAFADSKEIKLESVPGSKLKQGIIKHTLYGTAEEIWVTLTDVKNYPKTMPRNKSAEILQENGNVVRYHAEMNMPWPISDVSYDCDMTLDKPNWFLKFDIVPGTGKGVRNFTGSWKLDPISENEVKAEYVLLFEPDRNYPQWAMNIGLKATLGNIMKKMQDYLDTLHEEKEEKK